MELKVFMVYYKYIKKYLDFVALLLGIKTKLSLTRVMIALTYQCQCRCEHCSAAFYRQDYKKGLENGEIIKLIVESKKLGAKEIYFFGGEPLLVPSLGDFIRYAKHESLTTRLDTNGFLLDESMSKELKEAGLDKIGVSIDSPTEATHDQLRGINGLFKRALSGIQYCKKYNIKCYISTYVTKKNLRNGELEKMIILAKNLGVKIRILTSICSGRWSNRNDVLLSPEEIVLLKSFLRKKLAYWEIEYIDNKKIPFICSALTKTYFYISAYGDIQPCCFLPISFGNIRKDSLANILKKMWNSDMFTRRDKYNDCPINNKNFRDKYSKYFEIESQCSQLYNTKITSKYTD